MGRVALLLVASALLALAAGRRGAVVLGDEVGGALARASAPPRRHARDLHGFPRGEDEDVAHALLEVGAGEPGVAPVVLGGSANALAGPRRVATPARTRGVFVPAAVVMAFAKRGAIPAIDSRDGVRLRGVPPGTGLLDGDRLLLVGRARVRSIRDIVGLVTSAIFAGHTQISGVVQRGEDQIAVTVEIPTGATPAQ